MKNLKQFSVFLFFILMSISAYSQSAQQLQINEFVLYSTKAMKIDKEVKVNQTATNLKGTIGSKADISFKKFSVINANIIS